MRNKSCELVLVDENEKVLCSLLSVIVYDKYNDLDEGKMFYIHPLTNSKCENLSQVFSGWSEQDMGFNINWSTLIDNINMDKELMQKAWDMDRICYYV